MPIGGGSFTVQNKVLPGAYINFVSMGTNAKMGERGVAALPLELNNLKAAGNRSRYDCDCDRTRLEVFPGRLDCH